MYGLTRHASIHNEGSAGRGLEEVLSLIPSPEQLTGQFSCHATCHDAFSLPPHLMSTKVSQRHFPWSLPSHRSCVCRKLTANQVSLCGITELEHAFGLWRSSLSELTPARTEEESPRDGPSQLHQQVLQVYLCCPQMQTFDGGYVIDGTLEVMLLSQAGPIWKT